MTSSEVAKSSTQSQQVASKQPQYAREEKEQSASASASAGVCSSAIINHSIKPLIHLAAEPEHLWRNLRSLFRQVEEGKANRWQ